jgi:hypothetical protein
MNKNIKTYRDAVVGYINRLHECIINNDQFGIGVNLGYIEAIIRNQIDLDEVIERERGDAFTHPVYDGDYI